MTEYSIIGNSWDLGSWDGTGATYTNGLKSVRKINAIEYDKDYVFDRSIRDYLSHGWSGIENNYVWTEGKALFFLSRSTIPAIRSNSSPKPILSWRMGNCRVRMCMFS